MKLNTVNQSSVTMETRVEMHHMRYQNKGKGQFYEMGHSVSVQPGPPALRLRFSLYAHHLCQNMSR